MLQNKTESEPEGYEPGVEAAAELLRLSIPLMSRHRIPATPQNYAVWYHYVSGDRPELNAEIERLISDGQEFSTTVNLQLYKQHLAEHELNNVECVRSALADLLADARLSLTTAGDNAGNLGNTLDGLVSEVSNNNELRGIRQLLEHLLDETRSMQDVTQGIRSDFESKTKEIEELQAQLKRERERAITDPLTGLYNRQALFEHVESAIAERQENRPPAVVMLDIDHFKRINDEHGHLVGDRVIRFVGQTLLKNIKGRDSAARYGGEEFTLLLPETACAGAESVAESIRKAVAAAQLVRADNKKPLGRITISAGIAVYQQGEDVMDLIDRADRALYRAKREGRNRVCVA